ncbi:hypothetical protein ONS95_004618 [Cadophora gregata]|uniref:uncharacterized protein n=1 Tax=Cadophora gregata TaxID=51156 RepID=UPI0026DCD3E6|nr:uncharacterized protein ONS95_004618 [Cadophora gregata]KAK0105013.1 hypothetical protein ONS96_004419 [Cadophora gregata f. sp. sojae]KAK0106114.1 hypothetical protein ONS95_004618 [Cadophora gregata]
MKVAIQLDRPTSDQDPLFTSLDYVRGNVILSLQRADAVSRVTVVLSGTLFSSVVAAATNPLDGTLHAMNTHKLFEVDQPIFPPPDFPATSKGFSLPKGSNVFPFVLRFPILSTCSDTNHDWIKHLNTSLPPSTKVQAPNNVATGEVKYSIKVKVERPGRFKPDLTSQLELRFMPLDPSLPPPMLNPVSARTSRSLLRTSSRSSPPSSPPVSDRLDNSVITFEASLPSPAVLHTKHHLPLTISAIIKSGSRIPGSSVYLRSLALCLRIETIITVGPNSTTWPSLDELLNLSGLQIELSEAFPGQGEVDRELWKDVIIPEINPSFTSCTLVQQHFLVVAGGFSYGTEGSVQIIKTSINIDVHTGIKPNVRLDELNGDEVEEAPFIPWRVGSERHLGIMRRTDSVSTDVPPPAYS